MAVFEKLSPPIPMGFPDEWYGFADAGHFWLDGRFAAFKRFLKDRNLPLETPLRMLEIGCGRASFRSQLERATQWTVDGADINEAALAQASSGRGKLLLYNVHDRRPEFREAYDGVILFDVLEHLTEPGPFLQTALWHLKPGGWVFINVPALMVLYSEYDRKVGHFRRYDKKSMSDFLQTFASELHEIESRYWGFLLLPVACARKIVLAVIPSKSTVEVGFNPPFPLVNRLLRGLLAVEEKCFRHPPLGTSLLVAARKPN